MEKQIQKIEWLSFDPPCALFTPGLVAHEAGYIMGAVEPRYPLPVGYHATDIATMYLSLNTDLLDFVECLEDYFNIQGKQ
jgi:hypothetical protein